MNSGPKSVITFLGIFVILCLTSCSHLPEVGVGHRVSQIRQHLQDSVFRTSRLHQPKVEVDRRPSETRQHLQNGEFQKAADLFGSLEPGHPEYHELSRSFLEPIHVMKQRADKALDQKNYDSAGPGYGMLLKNYSTLQPCMKQLSIERTYLTTQVTHCSRLLMQKGLERYRSGDLREAISIWESILAFDPDNAEVRNVIHTASAQLQHLEQMK